jgi:hypothetical protein
VAQDEFCGNHCVAVLISCRSESILAEWIARRLSKESLSVRQAALPRVWPSPLRDVVTAKLWNVSKCAVFINGFVKTQRMRMASDFAARGLLPVGTI